MVGGVVAVAVLAPAARRREGGEARRRRGRSWPARHPGRAARDLAALAAAAWR